MQETKLLSIIIPIYNEEKTITKLLEKVSAVQLNVQKEIIVVNDGSTDSSSQLIKDWVTSSAKDIKIVFLEKENGGKGSAVRYGIENSKGNVVIIQDADLEYSPDDYKQCIDPIFEGKEKVVYGSRELLNSKRHYSYFSFFIGGLLITNWLNLLFGSTLTDEPTCYKAFDGDLIRNLSFKGNKFDWEPEITSKLLRLKYRIKEVGITYYPRCKEDGKKIKPVDGLMALWTIFLWRFMPVKREKMRVQSIVSERAHLKREKQCFNFLLVAFFIVFALRVLLSLPSIDAPLEKLTRPDSWGYIYPALSLAKTWTYNESADSKIPASYRVPGYPFYLALILKISGSFICVVITTCLLSALTSLYIFHSGHILGGFWAGLGALTLFCFNLTSIGIAPLLLSDTLFTFLISIQVFYFLKFVISHRSLFLFLAIIFSSLATLVRPINMFWIIPSMFLLLILKDIRFKKKVILFCCSICIFFVMLLPWMYRNYRCDAGFRLSNDYRDLLYHNGAVLLGKNNNKSAEYYRAALHAKTQKKFNNLPELYSSTKQQTDYEFSLMKDLILAHPLAYVSLHFRPWVLLPDVSSFCEVLGFTKSGRGTFDVLNTKGVWAAVLYYFDGKMYLLLLCLPLLLVVFLTYLFCFMELFLWVVHKKWLYLYLFLACVVYYLFLPGPITMPRYQLPALPFICVMASICFFRMFGVNKKTQ